MQKLVAPVKKYIYVTGASGGVGREVIKALKAASNDNYIMHVSRWEGYYSEATGAHEHVTWRDIEQYGFGENTSAVIHLSGEPLLETPFRPPSLKSIALSRLQGLELIKSAIAQRGSSVPLLISTSGVGVYPPSRDGGEVWHEGSPLGDSEFSDVSKAIENCASRAEGVDRIVTVRPGRVIGPNMACDSGFKAAKFFLAGTRGAGRQVVPWISARDLGRLYAHIVMDQSITGAVNAVSPTSATDAELENAVASAVNRPVLLKYPRFFTQMMFGKTVSDLMFTNQLVAPAKALETGFEFQDDNLVQVMANVKEELEEAKGVIGHGEYAI